MSDQGRSDWEDAAAASRIDRVGIQLYSVRKPAAANLATALVTIASIGYKEVELAGYYNHPASEVHELLAKNGLISPSGHIAIELLERVAVKTYADAKTIGHEWITVPSLPPGKRETTADWKALAVHFNEIAAEAKSEGFRFAFHNHNDIVRPLANGVVPIDVMMAETDPALVSYELDIFWAMNGGADPMALLAKYPSRFKMLHVKDGRPSQNSQTDVGKGSIDFARIFAHAPGVEHYFVESDTATDPFAFAAASYRYLSTLDF